jgi:hypothetical protein
LGVHLGGALLAQDAEDLLLRRGLVVRAVGREGIVDVGDGEDAGGNVEVFGLDAAVVAGASSFSWWFVAVSAMGLKGPTRERMSQVSFGCRLISSYPRS